MLTFIFTPCSLALFIILLNDLQNRGYGLTHATIALMLFPMIFSIIGYNITPSLGYIMWFVVMIATYIFMLYIEEHRNLDDYDGYDTRDGTRGNIVPQRRSILDDVVDGMEVVDADESTTPVPATPVIRKIEKINKIK